jgi:co-chaperonin GroES (HSP10)
VIIPRNDRVLLERIPPEIKSGHIILTDIQTIRWARVLAIGPEVYDVKEGDVVVLPGIAAEIPDFETGTQILVQEADIGAKIS